MGITITFGHNYIIWIYFHAKFGGPSMKIDWVTKKSLLNIKQEHEQEIVLYEYRDCNRLLSIELIYHTSDMETDQESCIRASVDFTVGRISDKLRSDGTNGWENIFKNMRSAHPTRMSRRLLRIYHLSNYFQILFMH